MNDERWIRNLARAARGHNAPPPTPRERMWEGIRRARGDAGQTGASPPRRPRRPGHRVLWPAAVLAALALGWSIGRQHVPAGDGPAPTPTVAAGDETARRPDTGPTRDSYRLAALPVLQRSETLLLQVRAGTAAGRDQHFSERAGTLLAETRLLLGSPASRDPQLGPLLRDLELSLARIVQLAADAGSDSGASIGSGTATDRKTLEDGLDRKAVLPRIRDQLAAGPPVSGL